MIDVSRLPLDAPLRVIIGAGTQFYDGWVATQKAQLDLLIEADWTQSFANRKADAFLCEHVWEHLTLAEAAAAARYCFAALRPGAYLRVAVPDGLFPNIEYQRSVQVGGPGPADHPAADHKVLYNYRQFSALFAAAGFGVTLLEYCDEGGRFHARDWELSLGPIYRSKRMDHRNKDGSLGFVSLILDAQRPRTPSAT